MKKVVSASRRTELLAHYPDYLVRRLRKLGPAQIHTVVLWTKDPANLLRHEELRGVLREVGQVFLHWTVTGLAGSFLEPNVPPVSHQFALLDDIVSYLGDPRRLHWRYDPLISARRGDCAAGNVDLDLFSSLAERFGGAGVPVVHTSFATAYRKVARRMAQAGVEMEDFAPDFRRSFLARMAACARGLGMELLTCCEPGYPRQRCIDGELLTTLHPSGEPCRTDRARGQRDLCGCTVSLDVGHYLPCPNQCLYCYARPAAASPRDGVRAAGESRGPE